MADPQRQSVIDLTTALEKLLGYDKDSLYERKEWGSKLTFNSFRSDFGRLFGLGKIFRDLPFELLPDANLTQIKNAVVNASTHLENISAFDSSTANNPQQTVQTLGSQVQAHADAVTTQMGPWISYLAYQKGDVSQNIANLEQAISRGEELIQETKVRIEAAEGEIKRIVQQAQDFAGDKGVTIFTEQFNAQADSYSRESKSWLNATVGSFVLAVIAIAIFMYELSDVTNPYEWISRATLIGILLSSGVWCGKNYRIIRHLESINLHKANGLKSFLLFRDAADNDETTRNAVLLETTKSIFSTPDSGFVPSSGGNGNADIRIVDGTKAAVALANAVKPSHA